MKTPKYRGTLKKWKDDRGFGFIQSDAEGKDIFVHISAFKRAKRRPKVGDAILYDLKTQPDGKVCASNALIEGATFKPRSQKKKRINYRFIKTAVGSVFIIAITIARIGFDRNSYQPRNSPRTISVGNPECKIKGNISHNSGDKVYHVPGAEDYQSTTIDTARGERWFCTEEEAIQNGWRKAPR